MYSPDELSKSLRSTLPSTLAVRLFDCNMLELLAKPAGSLFR